VLDGIRKNRASSNGDASPKRTSSAGLSLLAALVSSRIERGGNGATMASNRSLLQGQLYECAFEFIEGIAQSEVDIAIAVPAEHSLTFNANL